MATNKLLTDKHSFINEVIFHFKSGLFIIKRYLLNALTFNARYTAHSNLNYSPVISVSESELWNAEDTSENWILTAGKVENLRIALKKINGIQVAAGQVFSFWTHIGNPNRLKGYVLGREIREGCVVPTVAGGLCQLSNALYDAALKANFDIIERHKHTRVIKGSLAEQDKDATVKWNYVDLRFKADRAFQIEASLTSDTLIVQFRSDGNNVLQNQDKLHQTFHPSKLNDCYSCGNHSCFKHPRKANQTAKATTTYILSGTWEEYTTYVGQKASDRDVFIIPLYKNGYKWPVKNIQNLKTIPLVAIVNAIRLRLFSKSNVFKLGLSFDRRFALSASKKIPIESTHLVISQNLLPFVYESGILGGRTFDVLMTRLPFELLHQRLNVAHTKHPESKTLNDFRAPDSLVEVENIALTKSEHLVTPHQEIADIFNNKSIKLDWVTPTPIKTSKKGNKILFPASALGRKGAYEMKQLAKDLKLKLVVLGKATEDIGFWEDVETETAGAHIFDEIGIVVYPAYIEHKPNVLLKALASGIPVITTTACGLHHQPNLTILPVGDFDSLKKSFKLWQGECDTFQNS
jgi:hypothetical protein